MGFIGAFDAVLELIVLSGQEQRDLIVGGSRVAKRRRVPHGLSNFEFMAAHVVFPINGTPSTRNLCARGAPLRAPSMPSISLPVSYKVRTKKSGSKTQVGDFYFQAFNGSVSLPVAGYNYNSDRASRRCPSGPSSLAVAHLNLKLSRLSWSTDRQPISFMSRSISARRFSSALSTPA